MRKKRRNNGKSRSDYKTERGWQRHVWRQRKERLQEKHPELTEQVFNARVKEMQDQLNRKPGRKRKASFEEGANALERTEEFLPKADRLSENALAAIRKDKDALNALRKATGWKSKLDPANLRWDAKEKAYIYEGPQGKVMVDFTNSPKSIKVYSFHENPVTGKTVKRKR